MNKNINNVFIIRGFPGSGKSTLARFLKKGTGGVIIETDRFSNSNVTDVERFTHMMLTYRHYLLTREYDIILDGCHTQESEVRELQRYAQEYNFNVHIIEIPHEKPEILVQRTSHEISMKRMHEYFITYQNIYHRIPFKTISRLIYLFRSFFNGI